MDRSYDYHSSDYERYRENSSSRRDSDMRDRYNRRSPPVDSVYVMNENYGAHREEKRDEWRDRHNQHEISPDHRRRDTPPRPGPDYSRVREASPKYHKSSERFSPGERRSSSLERVDRDYRDSSRDRYEDRRSRSPHSSPPGEDNYVRETTVIRIEQIPEDITETEIRVELQAFGAPICSVEMESAPGTDDPRTRVCFVEFTDIRDSTSWMQRQKGELYLNGARMPVFYSDRKPQNVPRRDRQRDYDRDRYDRRSSERDRRESSRDSRSYDRDRVESSRDRRDHDRDRRNRDDDRDRRDYDRDRRDRRDRDDDRDRDRRDRRDDYDDRSYRRISHEPGERRERDHRPFSSRTNKKTDTMIVMGLDKTTKLEVIKAAFQYITHFKIVDIRLVKDKFGASRGFCFVQWESVDECSQVLEYLKTATPRFNIEGRQVQLDYSQPRTPEPHSASSSSANVAAAAIEAAKWSRLGGDSKDSKPSSNGDKAETAMAQIAKAQEQVQAMHKPKPNAHSNKPGPMPMPGQFWPPAMMWQAMANMQAQMQRPQRYPTPDISKYTYDETSGHYYDATTGLYYNSNTRYYYNSYSGVYLYWDQKTHTYVPVSSETQAEQVKAEKDKIEKDFQNKDKSKSAKQIAKDMARWAKAQNKKKEEIKRLMDDNTAATKKESSTGDIGFSLLEKKVSEEERRATVKDAFASDIFKSPAMSAMRKVGEVMSPLVMANPSAAIPGLASYDEGSDSEEETDQPQISFEERLEQMTDWNKMACLLCRRAFASKEALQKHQKVSDLHKQNVETLRSKTKPTSSGQTSEQTKYRDRAAERRSKYGIADPPLKKARYNRSAVPYEQPTKDGIDDSNIGNKMLQKMGWKSGSGLGKSQSGITVPIMAEQRTMGAGLGVRGSRLGTSSGDSYRDTARQRIMARYQDAD